MRRRARSSRLNSMDRSIRHNGVGDEKSLNKSSALKQFRTPYPFYHNCRRRGVVVPCARHVSLRPIIRLSNGARRLSRSSRATCLYLGGVRPAALGPSLRPRALPLSIARQGNVSPAACALWPRGAVGGVGLSGRAAQQQHTTTAKHQSLTASGCPQEGSGAHAVCRPARWSTAWCRGESQGGDMPASLAWPMLRSGNVRPTNSGETMPLPGS
jgi:hypothetical protein